MTKKSSKHKRKAQGITEKRIQETRVKQSNGKSVDKRLKKRKRQLEKNCIPHSMIMQKITALETSTFEALQKLTETIMADSVNDTNGWQAKVASLQRDINETIPKQATEIERNQKNVEETLSKRNKIIVKTQSSVKDIIAGLKSKLDNIINKQL